MRVRSVSLGLGIAMLVIAVVAAVSRSWLSAASMVIGATAMFINYFTTGDRLTTVGEAVRDASRARLLVAAAVVAAAVALAVIVAVRAT